MKTSKCMIATDGNCTIAYLDGVCIGSGITRLEFLAEGTESKIRLLDIDIKNAELTQGPERFEAFLNAMEE